MAGTLFVVATPIGNLEDITLRALRTLREVDLIAAEDTRRTAKLLARHQIQKSMVSLHLHNEQRETPRLLARLEAGQSIALVSDAGTPGIADPGEHLVHKAHERGIRVVPIPGPSAIMAALSTSGFPASEFVFLGFPPRSGPARAAWLERLKAEPRTQVVFEAPHRIGSLLGDLTATLADRPIQVHKELTKIHELLVTSPFNKLTPDVSLGEFVIVISNSAKNSDVNETASRLDKALQLIGCITNCCDYRDDEAVGLAALVHHLDRRTVRNAWKKHQIALKRAGRPLS